MPTRLVYALALALLAIVFDAGQAAALDSEAEQCIAAGEVACLAPVVKQANEFEAARRYGEAAALHDELSVRAVALGERGRMLRLAKAIELWYAAAQANRHQPALCGQHASMAVAACARRSSFAIVADILQTPAVREACNRAATKEICELPCDAVAAAFDERKQSCSAAAKWLECGKAADLPVDQQLALADHAVASSSSCLAETACAADRLAAHNNALQQAKQACAARVAMLPAAGEAAATSCTAIASQAECAAAPAASRSMVRWAAVAAGAVAIGVATAALLQYNSLNDAKFPSSDTYDLTRISYPELRQREADIGAMWGAAAGAGALAVASAVLALWPEHSENTSVFQVMPNRSGAALAWRF
ncbi:MAG: hypothetical protein HY902_18125 [Deltaproteobacteria bacterium]|nr:hypothetical protein [Deltaproteobacteria bacterium]